MGELCCSLQRDAPALHPGSLPPPASPRSHVPTLLFFAPSSEAFRSTQEVAALHLAPNCVRSPRKRTRFGEPSEGRAQSTTTTTTCALPEPATHQPGGSPGPARAVSARAAAKTPRQQRSPQEPCRTARQQGRGDTACSAARARSPLAPAALSPAALPSPQPRSLGTELLRAPGVVSMEIKKNLAAQLHQNVDWLPVLRRPLINNNSNDTGGGRETLWQG